MSLDRLLRLNSLQPGRQEAVEVWNSPLSEAAVLGYEYGYSLGCAGRALVVWEAQFGDFANNAQVIIDQFVAAGEHAFVFVPLPPIPNLW
jgi:2-oxoglutarate dehydrogenase E1 component